VILLDEATSALDNANEAKVQTALDTLARRGSALVIAHRLSTIKDSDMIAVVDHGRVVESGTHDELLAKLQPDDSHGDEEDGAIDASPEGTAAGDVPLAPRRQASAPAASRAPKAPASETRATYRKLWDAATGSTGHLSLEALATKIGAAEDELARLKKRQARMLRHKAALLDTARLPADGSSLGSSSRSSFVSIDHQHSPRSVHEFFGDDETLAPPVVARAKSDGA